MATKPIGVAVFVFRVFGASAGSEREIVLSRTIAGIASVRARGKSL